MTVESDAPQTMADLIPATTVPSSSGTTRGVTDGRVALRMRNRQRVIDALIELVDGGEISPSMESIVDRSGVSERSVFRYFTDLADLSLSAVRAVMERAEPARVIHDQGEGSLEYRIDQMIAARLRVATLTHSFGMLARRKLAVVPEIQQGLSNVKILLRSQFRQQFGPELDTMSETEATVTMDLLVTMLSFEGLDVMWRQLDNDHAAVTQRWRVMMTALLAPHVDTA